MSSEPSSPSTAPSEVRKASSDIENSCPDTSAEEMEKTIVVTTTNTNAPNDAPPKRQASKTNSTNRGRIVSLDRIVVGTDLATSAIDDNSTVTSDGESSYFAKDLPSPKSGRPFSDAASSSSAPDRTGLYHLYRESDASLSFSDDDDDEHAPRIEVSKSPLLPPRPPSRENFDNLLLFPQRSIIRMHSVSSLVSSEGEGRGAMESKQQVDDDESDAELQEIDPRVPSTISDRPSGRNLPTSFFAPFFPSPTPTNPQPSPPTILSYSDIPTLPHPQPQIPQQHLLPIWMAAGNAAAVGNQPILQHHPHFMGYGATFAAPLHPLQTSPRSAEGGKCHSGNSIETLGADSRGSHATLPMVYSEDEDTDEGGVPVYKMALGDQGRGTTAETGMPSGTRTNVGSQGAVGKKNGVERAMETHLGAFHNTGGPAGEGESPSPEKDFLVYWQRWVMLGLMSVLNLLSDWTCYSVAPIAMLTNEAFGKIDPEQLVVVFLSANVVSTAFEPIILSRLGLRRTVVFGSLLLMMGSIIKSGGFPPIIESTLEKGHGEWRIYLGFFLVGLSQPLYQCTPALLSTSWFPESERTLATGVALNSNQLGIGLAFIFGTLLVSTSDDIVPYFGLLSIMSTVACIGTLFSFDDAPPTPPSDTARVIRGTFEWRLPNADELWKTVQTLGGNSSQAKRQRGGRRSTRRSSTQYSTGNSERVSSRKSDISTTASVARRRSGAPNRTVDSGFRETVPSPPPSSASTDQAVNKQIESWEHELLLPSPMLPGEVGQQPRREDDDVYTNREPHGQQNHPGLGDPLVVNQSYGYPPQALPMYGHVGMSRDPSFYGVPHWSPQPQYYDARYSQNPYQFQGYPAQPSQGAYASQPGYLYSSTGSAYYPMGYPQQYYGIYDPEETIGPPSGTFDDGTEPTLTITDHNLDINIRDDQVILSIRACFSRPGFVHALVAFTASGIVINTLSTFMDYLVRLNGAGREYVGIVGGLFQIVIMISSLIIGRQTDKTRAYYSVTIGMLVLGAFALAECGVSLDADRAGDLRWCLVIVGCLVGPLQPVSTELGVEVAYPLSENTVLVIQQLFSNLLSALFIPFFKALKDIGTERINEGAELYERPQYTFSFYLLIVIHASVTVFFATFNGRYLRYEHEVAKRAQDERNVGPMAPLFDPVEENFNSMIYDRARLPGSYSYQSDELHYPSERQPLVGRGSGGL